MRAQKRFNISGVDFAWSNCHERFHYFLECQSEQSLVLS
jgi:hypothetical protein